MTGAPLIGYVGLAAQALLEHDGETMASLLEGAKAYLTPEQLAIFVAMTTGCRDCGHPREECGGQWIDRESGPGAP